MTRLRTSHVPVVPAWYGICSNGGRCSVNLLAVLPRCLGIGTFESSGRNWTEKSLQAKGSSKSRSCHHGLQRSSDNRKRWR